MGSSGLCHLESVNAIVDDKGHGSLKNTEPKTNGRYSYKNESYLGRWGCGKDGRGETVIRMYCMKKYFK